MPHAACMQGAGTFFKRAPPRHRAPSRRYSSIEEDFGEAGEEGAKYAPHPMPPHVSPHITPRSSQAVHLSPTSCRLTSSKLYRMLRDCGVVDPSAEHKQATLPPCPCPMVMPHGHAPCLAQPFASPPQPAPPSPPPSGAPAVQPRPRSRVSAPGVGILRGWAPAPDPDPTVKLQYLSTARSIESDPNPNSNPSWRPSKAPLLSSLNASSPTCTIGAWANCSR